MPEEIPNQPEAILQTTRAGRRKKGKPRSTDFLPVPPPLKLTSEGVVDFTGTLREQAAADRLFNTKVGFLASVRNIKDIPNTDLPEIAFAGRSNVGKSSLWNAILGTESAKLFQTSKTPGRTQALNYYILNNKLALVDMPGYGFAEAPVEEVKKWKKLVHEYLLNERQLIRRICLLIDARHGFTKHDFEIMKFLDDSQMVLYQIILTKIDKVSKSHLDFLLPKIRKEMNTHPACFPELIKTSAEKKIGLSELRTSLLNATELLFDNIVQ